MTLQHYARPVNWRGSIRLVVFDAAGAVADLLEFENTITNDGLDLLAGALIGNDAQIKYLAWGNDNTLPAATDTELGNELGRKAVTATSNPAGVGNVLTTTYLGPGDANETIEEIGWFGGVDADADADSGVLVARVLYSKTKTNLEAIQVERTDTVS